MAPGCLRVAGTRAPAAGGAQHAEVGREEGPRGRSQVSSQLQIPLLWGIRGGEFRPQTCISLARRRHDFLSKVLHLPLAPRGARCLEGWGAVASLEETSRLPSPHLDLSKSTRRGPRGRFDPSGRERFVGSSQGLSPSGRLRSWADEGVREA